jgi:hypothetical protein
MAYRDDLIALAARHASLEAEVATKTKELAAASRLLEEAQARTRLPILDNIRIASPCKARWSEMDGDDRLRQCGACNKQVFDISSLTRDEAQALIVEHAGTLCGRYYQRADGTIMLADCTIGASQRRTRKLLAAGAAVAFAGAVAAQVVPERVEARTLDGDLGLPVAHEQVSLSGSGYAEPDVEPYQEMLGELRF